MAFLWCYDTDVNFLVHVDCWCWCWWCCNVSDNISTDSRIRLVFQAMGPSLRIFSNMVIAGKWMDEWSKNDCCYETLSLYVAQRALYLCSMRNYFQQRRLSSLNPQRSSFKKLLVTGYTDKKFQCLQPATHLTFEWRKETDVFQEWFTWHCRDSNPGSLDELLDYDASRGMAQ